MLNTTILSKPNQFSKKSTKSGKLSIIGIVLLLIVISLTSVLFSSCKKTDSASNQIVGYWIDKSDSLGWIFYSDHTFFANGKTATYSISGNKIHIIPSGKNSFDKEVTVTFEIENGVLTVHEGKESSSFVKMTPSEIAELKNESHVK